MQNFKVGGSNSYSAVELKKKEVFELNKDCQNNDVASY